MKKIKPFRGAILPTAFVIKLLVLFSVVNKSVFCMEVDLFVHKDKFGKSLNLDLGDKECTNVPRLWSNLTMSVDTHGSCMQFYDSKNCKGRIAVIQPFHAVHQMDLSLINFHNVIQSVSPCGAKVPSGRYVIQSAVDASILTVSKHENEFARVSTLPPQAFIPKAQQWEVSEKHPNEFDIMPRIHETNYPVTYDGEAMKKGSFIRKIWKVESVGRGRYIFKSEWTQKCLYKTRIRTVEEHDCRAWSPNQEWVLRPLIAPTKPPPTPNPQLADGVNFQVPSRVVDKYLYEQKKLREKEKNRRNKNEEKERDHAGAYLEPYRIRYKKTKKNSENDDEDDDDDNGRHGIRQSVPPGPQILYSRPAPIYSYRPQPQYKQPGKVLAYMEGVAPIYEDAKVEDPVFPDFLLHAASTSLTTDNRKKDDEYTPPRYQVTRRPFHPQPTGHPDYIPEKKKYDGRVKEQFSSDAEEDEEESAEDEEEGQHQGEKVREESDEENSQEEDIQIQRPIQQSAGQIGHDEGTEVEAAYTAAQQNAPKIVHTDKVKEGVEEENESQEDEKVKGEEEEEEEEESQEEEKSVSPDEEISQEDTQPNNKRDKEQKDQVAPTTSSKVSKRPKEETNSEDIEEGDDPARDVASFMKLLFQGINNKMTHNKKTHDAVTDLLK